MTKRALGGTAPPMRGYPRNPRGLPYELQVEAKKDGGIIDKALDYANWLAFKAYNPDDIRSYEEFSEQHKKRDVAQEQRDWGEQVKNEVKSRIKNDRDAFFDEVYGQWKRYLDRMAWRSDVFTFKEWYENDYGSPLPADFEKRKLERDGMDKKARGGLVYKKSDGGSVHRINVDERQNDIDIQIRSLIEQHRNHPRVVEFLQQVNERRHQPNFDYNRLMRLANQFFGIQRNARGGLVFSTSNIAKHMKSDRY
jgi:hypothetical protein